MARYKVSAPLSGIRGTVGGLTYSQNAAAQYVKAWARPPRKRTNRQTLERALYSSAPAQWRSLTAAERGLWDVYAGQAAQALTDPFGDTYYASGWNWFVRINSNLYRMGRAGRSVPPVTGTPGMPTINALNLSVSDPPESQVTYPSGEFTGFDIVIKIGRCGSTGVLEKNSRFWTVEEDQGPGLTAEGFQAGLEAAFGVIAVGQRYTAWVYRQSDQGRRSAPTSITDDV